mmetsp:Transcript_26292/g.37042  ORF Transcript_26292/g.37042 Transcript_26292/m.37042 type:complete len:477 (+) Transcript_26292:46-1476(+)
MAHNGEAPSKEDGAPKRVVSLLGASTETLFRLGLGSAVVGRSHECDYPPLCLSIPCISRPRLDVDACSSDIDAAVRAHSAAGEPVYKLDDAIISDLKPDLIIAQDHCRVCAITPNEMKSSEACSQIPQVIVKPSTLQDCLDDVTTIANAMGYPERGQTLKETLVKRMDRVRKLTAEALSDGNVNKKARVALLEWCDPIMGCGYWIPELVDVAGGTPLHCPPPGGATPTISFQSLLDSKPDVVVFALCGFGLTRAATELTRSWGAGKINQLKMITNGRVFVIDGNYLVNRSGPRVVESSEALAEVIHPSLQGHFGHFGTDLLSTIDHAVVLAKSGEETGSAKDRLLPLEEQIKDAPTSAIVVPQCGPEEIVQEQLNSLHEGDIMHAFALNSTANQSRWCSVERFEAILKSHGDFCRLLSQTAKITNVSLVGEMATVSVNLAEQDCEPSVGLIWTMISEISDGAETPRWRTEKVSMAH